MAISGNYYIDTASFSDANAVWTNSTLTTKAPDGYYSFDGNYRQQLNGFLHPITSCPVCDPQGTFYYSYCEDCLLYYAEADGNCGTQFEDQGFSSSCPGCGGGFFCDCGFGCGIYIDPCYTFGCNDCLSPV
jgi:hypothetical protein